MTTISIVHEADTQRQHARLRVPAYARIEGRRLEVSELSVGGLGLPRSDLRLHVGQRIRLALDVPFDDALSLEGVWLRTRPDPRKPSHSGPPRPEDHIEPSARRTTSQALSDQAAGRRRAGTRADPG